MRIKQIVAGLTATVVAFSGISLATASPAAAIPRVEGHWVDYNRTNPAPAEYWYCAASKLLATSVAARNCLILQNGTVRTAIIVRNNRSTTFSAYAHADLINQNPYQERATYYCDSKRLKKKSWTVCFGTVISELPSGTSRSDGYAMGIYLGSVG